MTKGHLSIGTLLFVCVTLAGASCGSPSAPSSESAAATITITAAGVVPREVRIDNWNHIRFVNNDTVPHQIVSDPVNAHSECPGINGVGYLPPGSTGETRTLTDPKVCGFHDHLNQLDDSFRGRIVVED